LARTISLLSMLCLVFLVASPAEGGRANAYRCGGKEFSYAGLQSESKAHGVSATIVPLQVPSVADGHVGGWIGVGGTDAGPGGTAEWLQVGLASFAPDSTIRLYYEVTALAKGETSPIVTGQQLTDGAPHYIELDANVQPGDKHELAVLEMQKRNSWWRVWVDNKPVSPPLHLVGSHGKWYPQALAENWNGGTGACNTYAYRFSDVKLAHTNGGVWKTLKSRSLFQDAGYQVVQTSRVPSSFLATSLG
jgi:hypothetical protein